MFRTPITLQWVLPFAAATVTNIGKPKPDPRFEDRNLVAYNDWKFRYAMAEADLTAHIDLHFDHEVHDHSCNGCDLLAVAITTLEDEYEVNFR
jgi:predicted component of type VI protein secretion system